MYAREYARWVKICCCIAQDETQGSISGRSARIHRAEKLCLKIGVTRVMLLGPSIETREEHLQQWIHRSKLRYCLEAVGQKAACVLFKAVRVANTETGSILPNNSHDVWHLTLHAAFPCFRPVFCLTDIQAAQEGQLLPRCSR